MGVLVYGDAELNFDYGLGEATEMHEKYMPHEQAVNFARNMSRESKGGGVKITVKPIKIITFDTRKDEFLRSMAEI